MVSQFRRFFAALVALAAVPAVAAAQGGTVTGTVTDRASNQPIVNAQVFLVGTTRGALTSEQGVYRIANVPPGQVQVRVLRIGYEAATQSSTVTPGGTATVNFALAASAVQFDRVVVTATGESQRRRESGNSVGTIDVAEEVALPAVENLSNVLAARTPGLISQQEGGTAGSSSRIRIRGSNSVSLNNDPLIIVDGVRMNGSQSSMTIGVGGQSVSRVDDINPEDVENISVIKGPAAAALYGTAAANGVIQITTKRGRAGSARWSLYGEGGQIEQFTDFPLNYAQVGTLTSNNARTAGCTLANQSAGTCVANPDSLVAYSPLIGANPFRDGWKQAYGLSVAGGSDIVTYYVSSDFEREQGIYDWNSLRRVNLRANLRAQIRDNLSVDVTTGYLDSDLRLPQNDNNFLGVLGSGLLGSAFDNPEGRGYVIGITPEEISSIETFQHVNRFTTGLSSTWQPKNWLSVNGTVGIDYVNRVDQELISPNRVFAFGLEEGERTSNPTQIFTYTANANASGTFDLTPAIQSVTSFGVQYNEDQSYSTRAFGARQLPGTGSLAGTSARFAVNEVNAENVTIGAYISQQFGWNDRVFLTGSVRGDDNSAFGQDFGIVYYPAASLSWVIGEESFFPQNEWLSALRVRAAYGESGQRPAFRDAITFFDAVAVSINNAETPAISLGGTGNVDLSPEISREYEFGFDAGLIRDRANLEFTYYHKTTSDALINRRIAPDVGATIGRFENIGEVENKGYEVLLNATLLERSNTRWNVSLSYAHNDNKLIELGENVAPIIFGRQQFREGVELGAYFDRPILSFEDANSDGIITLGEVTLGDTAVYVGRSQPRREVTISSDLSLTSWLRLSAVLNHRGDYKQLNLGERFRCAFTRNCQALYDPSSSLADQARAVVALQGLSDFGYIEDSDFWKLREVAVTLTAPTQWTRSLRLSGLSLTLAGRNLKTWTDYRGLDPEVNSAGGLNFNQLEFFTQPQLERYSARFNVTF